MLSDKTAFADYPRGCFLFRKDSDVRAAVYFNPHPAGAAQQDSAAVCRSASTASPTREGDTSAPTALTPTAAPWSASPTYAGALRPERVSVRMHARARMRARAQRHALLLHAMACAGEVNSISMPSPSGTWTWDCTANCTALPFCAINAFNKGLTGAVPASIGQLSCRKNVTAVYALASGGCVSTLRQAALSHRRRLQDLVSE